MIGAANGKLKETLERALEKYKKYIVEENRRATFKKWIFNDSRPCSADKMAEAGFIFTGTTREPDVVTCFYCEKILDGWESSDDPWKEHLKHAAYCEFAQLQRPQKQVTVKDHIELRKVYLKRAVMKTGEKMKSEFRENCNKIIKNTKES